MPQIDCPNCGAPVDSSERACPYCGTALSAKSASVPPQIQMDRDLFSGQIGLNTSDSDQFREVREQIERGNKIEAIRLYREATGVGLKEAKDAVEAMETGRPVIATAATIVSGSAVVKASFASSAALMDEVKRLLRAGNKIEAIKIYRQYFDVGLAEAKTAVDQVETDLKFSGAPEIPASPSSLSSQEPVMGPNPFDEPKKSSSARGWLVGCGVALLLLCLCSAIPLVLFLSGFFSQR